MRLGFGQRATSFGFALVCGLLLSSAASAQLVIVVGETDDPIVQRLQNELELLGYETQIAAGPRHRWARMARERDAAAVAEVRGDDGEVVLWPAPVALREDADAGQHVASDEERELALHAAELLNGRLRATEPRPEAPQPEAPSGADPAAQEAEAEPRRPREARVGSVGLLVGPSLTAMAGGIPATVGFRGHGVWRPCPWLEVGPLVLVPLSAGTVTVSGGEAEARSFAVGLQAQLRWQFGPVALGAGPELLAQRSLYDVKLEASAYDDTSDAAWAPRMGAGVSGAWFVHRRVALRADAMLDAILPPLAVMDPANPSAVQQERRETVAKMGNPVSTTSIGIELQF